MDKRFILYNNFSDTSSFEISTSGNCKNIYFFGTRDLYLEICIVTAVAIEARRICNHNFPVATTIIAYKMETQSMDMAVILA
jgi:hypothetical protein